MIQSGGLEMILQKLKNMENIEGDLELTSSHAFIHLI